MGLPVPKLDDKTFAQLVDEARSLIPRYAPEWTDHNLHDPGITFMELFAWLTEMQIYSLDRITNQQKLKFLRLLNIQPRIVSPAHVLVTFSIQDNMSPIYVEKATQLSTARDHTEAEMVFETDADLFVSPLSLSEILTFDQTGFTINTSANHQNGLFYYAFGEKPAADNSFYLGLINHDKLPDQEITLWIQLYECDLPATVEPINTIHLLPQAKLIWEYWSDKNTWQTLNIIKDHTTALLRSGNIVFRLPQDAVRHRLYTLEEELFWIRCRIKLSEYNIPPRIDSILLNTVMAVQQQSQAKETTEILGSSDGLPHQVFTMTHVPIIKDSEMIEVEEVKGAWQLWRRVDDFDASGPDDRHYQLNFLTGEVMFGDGIRGKIPPIGSDNIRCRHYATSNGSKGNILANKIRRVKSHQLSQVAVTNRFDASGGSDAEDLTATIAQAKKELNSQFRAVTSDDYEKLALSTPGIRVARARALPMYHPCYPCYPIPGAVTVVVVPYIQSKSQIDKPLPGANFRRMVYQHLAKRRLLTTQLFVISPKYVQVTVKTAIQIKPKSDPSRVKRDVEEALTKFLNPLYGGPDQQGWQFGRSVMTSELHHLINQIDGVNCVKQISLIADNSCAEKICDDIKIPPNALVYSGIHEVQIE